MIKKAIGLQTFFNFMFLRDSYNSYVHHSSISAAHNNDSSNEALETSTQDDIYSTNALTFSANLSKYLTFLCLHGCIKIVSMFTWH